MSALRVELATDDDPAPPGWYLDPLGEVPWRWWDGRRWLADGAPEAVRERAWLPERDDRDHAIRGGLLALVGFVAAVALGYGVSFAAVEWGHADEDSLLVLGIGQVGLWAGMFATCVVAARRNGVRLRDLGLRRLRGEDFAVGSVVGVVARVVCALVALVFVVAFPLDSFRNTSSGTSGIEPSVPAALVLVLVVCVGAPFFEELYFRGLVQGVLTRRVGARLAVLTQAVGFALVHYRIGMSLVLTLATWSQILVAGVLLGFARWRYERLGPGMVAHALFNAIAIAVLIATWLLPDPSRYGLVIHV